MNAHLIMVVDDSEDIREILRIRLQADGFRVVTCADYKSALRQLSRCEPSLVTLDIMLPGRGGIELLQEIRKRDKNLPVIMVSAYGDFRQDFKVWASDDYILKGADLAEQVAQRVKQLLT